MKTLVTVIIPIYNEENNITSCVSILKQQINQNFNVIFIDDGSTDKTVDILKECLISDIIFKYKIVSQKNLGAAAARQNGIFLAETEYVMIFDCDDSLSSNYIEDFYSAHINENADIFIPNVKIEKSKDNWIDFSLFTEDEQLNPKDCILNSLDGWKVHGWFICRKSIFLKSYDEYYMYNIEKYNFINNDEVLTRLNFKNSEKIIKLKALYYYCYNENSTTKRINGNKYLMVNNAYILYQMLSSDKEFNICVKNELLNSLWGTFRYMHYNKKELENFNEWQLLLKEKLKKINYYEYVINLNFKSKIKLFLLKLLNL
ncbi:glycosyltransferase family 2 protein [Acinetobacter bereziniae]|uniref:glycosyltransferase family 2 protein n=1 Tax=Acinetobacter bereziniae TaxID=106648 RepID=UPI00207517E1|nr:glycosyltransferase family 2 protein [Acinetobacter bereziniae]MCM8512865.1 glycosyltransferase family 2 protein [Acinetobacter bereziniae]